MLKEAVFLVVDDEQEVCNFFSYLLRQKGYKAVTANTGAEASEKLKNYTFATALVDLKLPDANGLDILKEIKSVQPECEVIIITGYSTVKSAVEAIQLGAFDYVEKPFVDINEMELLLDRSLNVKAETEELSLAQQELGFLIGRNQKMISLVSAAQKIAKKNITVLIQGETGTGKEVLARYLHSVSHRSDRPFLAFNCGAFTETLLESELFGHEKGSFTGASHKKKEFSKWLIRLPCFWMRSTQPARLFRLNYCAFWRQVNSCELAVRKCARWTCALLPLQTLILPIKWPPTRSGKIYSIDWMSLHCKFPL